MKRALTFPKIAGIQVSIHWTFWLIILWIVYVNMKAGMDAMQIGWSVLFILCLFICVILHEYGHAMAARYYGIKTRDITLYPIGGVARLEKMPEQPLHELVVALAGPLVNVVIMILLLPFFSDFDIMNASGENVMVISALNFLPMLGIINIWLALFNLIPAFPMDGGRVLRALLAMKTDRLRATETAAAIGKILAIGFIILGFYLNPFLVFIGIFIILGAQAETELVKTQFFISDMTASDALMSNFSTIDKNQIIGDAVKLLLNGEARNFVVTKDDIPYGTIGREHIIKGIKEHGEGAKIEKITDVNLSFVDINTPLKEVFTQFQVTKSVLMLVMENNKLTGVIDAENISELIMVRTARIK